LLEGKVGCTLRHPNIVAIYDVMSPGRTHVIVMEFVEGRNLREFVQIRKKIDPVEATRLITGLTDGLRYAFEHGVTHRDLKMSNILVSSRGEAKLVDFGMAAMDETLADDRMADLPNTRAIDYAALERATGVRKDDTRSDIYFLGCIYYNMLSGKPPFPETRDRMQRLSKQKFIDIVPIQRLEPAIPSAVALVVNKAMMLDPARRYSAPSAMLADLRVAAKRLANGTADQVDGFDGDPAATGNPSALAPRESAPLPEAESERSVMVIESNIQMQNIFRDGFKRIGYRVLMTSNPDHAASRILQNAAIADCLVINAQFLGESALAMFNQLAENPKTKQIPAMLLLDENQHAWESRAETTPTRVVLRLPVTMRKLLGSVQALITSAAPK
jgi:serine/threonine-protein kinase